MRSLARHHNARIFAISVCFRPYSTPRTQKSKPPQPAAQNTPSNELKTNTQNSSIVEPRDRINPVPSTRPPPLHLPVRGSEARAAYWWKLGRAYGSFFKTGVFAIFKNISLAKAAKTRLEKELGSEYLFSTRKLLRHSIAREIITRAEYQLIKRSQHDVGKLPIFAILVLLLGEWLPLFVPFMPYAVPLTCRYPSQRTQMIQKAEERRRSSFREGIQEPAQEELKEAVQKALEGLQKDSGLWSLAEPKFSKRLLSGLRADQLVHLSSVLNLHGRIWNRIQLPPPTFLLRTRVGRRLQDITQDDALLDRAGGISDLIDDEVTMACEERGIDVTGRSQDVLRQMLAGWLKRQRNDKGQGIAVMDMLFRRPNAWRRISA